MRPPHVTSAEGLALKQLGTDLQTLAADLHDGRWPARQLERLGQAGVFEWFLPDTWGGQAWSDSELVEGFRALGSACLTTSFILTQRAAACARLVASHQPCFREQYSAGLLDGSLFATVAISHLTTSRRHLEQPVLRAVETGGGFRVDGYSPWVTGAAHADLIVTGATLPDGQQILLALQPGMAGVHVAPPERLVALSASHTGRLECTTVEVPRSALIAGPAPDVMRLVGGGAGGLQTSALAVGLADSAIDFIEQQAVIRRDLSAVGQALREEWTGIRGDLRSVAREEGSCTRDEVRLRANSLVLRASQAALGSAKGTGYVDSHPTGRWCREALFFLVWSCPQSVLTANLCQLALLDSAEEPR